MRRLIAHVLGRQRADRPSPTDWPSPAAPAQPLPRHDAQEPRPAGPPAQLFKNRRCCPACGSVRSATLAVLRAEPPEHWTAQRRCRACGHDWEEATDGMAVR
jgi:hypothetical protein